MNPLREKWQNDECTIGAWLSIPSAVTAEIIGRAGFDYACVDVQHGMVDYADALAMFQAIELGNSVPFARVTWNEPGIIGRMLDLGAGGVIIPMVNTPADATAAVASCRYAPVGRRSTSRHLSLRPAIAGVRAETDETTSHAVAGTGLLAVAVGPGVNDDR